MLGRSVPLTREATAALREHRKRQLEEWMEHAGLWQDHGLVFTSGVDTPLLEGNLNRAFKATLQCAGLPGIRFHDLRHTCATLLLRQGVNPKYVQELLGHANISLTLNVYSHVLPDMRRRSRRDGRCARIASVVSERCQKTPAQNRGSFLLRFAGRIESAPGRI